MTQVSLLLCLDLQKQCSGKINVGRKDEPTSNITTEWKSAFSKTIEPLGPQSLFSWKALSHFKYKNPRNGLACVLSGWSVGPQTKGSWVRFRQGHRYWAQVQGCVPEATNQCTSFTLMFFPPPPRFLLHPSLYSLQKAMKKTSSGEDF